MIEKVLEVEGMVQIAAIRKHMKRLAHVPISGVHLYLCTHELCFLCHRHCWNYEQCR